MLSVITRFLSKRDSRLPEQFLLYSVKMYKAIIEVEADDAEAIVISLEPDLDDAERFKVKLGSEDGKIVMEFEATDAAAMRAAINSYLKLVGMLADSNMEDKK